MKKALTIYIDDGVDLRAFAGAWICRRGLVDDSVTLQTLTIKDGNNALYLPFKAFSDAPSCLFNDEEGFPNEEEWNKELTETEGNR